MPSTGNRTVTHECDAIVNAIPYWSEVTKSRRGMIRAAIKAVRVTSIEELLSLSDEQLVKQIKQNYQRSGLSSVVRNARFVRYHLRAKVTCSTTQRDVIAKSWPECTQYDQLVLLYAFTVLGVEDVESMLRMSDKEILTRIGTQDTIECAIEAVAACLNRIGRNMRITPSLVRKCSLFHEETLSNVEVDWLKNNPNHQHDYLSCREKFVLHLRKHHGVNDRRQLRRYTCFMHEFMVQLAMPRMWKNLQDIPEEEALSVAVDMVKRGLQRKTSLFYQKRRTRRTTSHEPGYDLCKAVGMVLQRLMAFWGVKECRDIQMQVWHMAKDHFIHQSMELRSFTDALSTREMLDAIEATDNIRDKLLLTLLGHLGMRVGAVSQLRISGVVENFGPHLRESETWQISRVIRGIDKGRKTNEWDTMFDPVVNERLQLYVNDHWRKQHEKWITRDGCPALLNGFLFPGGIEGNCMAPWNIHRVVIKACRKVGVDLVEHFWAVQPAHTDLRAHPHAFRKGVVTALLRAGNPLTTVSKFVHHSTTSVTEASYDKRTYDEIVNNMVLPIEWERSFESEPNVHEQEESDLPSADTGPSTEAAAALLEQMQANDELRCQLKAALSLLGPEQLKNWERQCSTRTD